MSALEFFVPGTPVGQPRPRARVVNIPGQRPRAQVYDARGKSQTFRQRLMVVVSENYDGPPLDGALEVHILAFFPRPKSMVWRRRPMPRTPKHTKPDLDNVVKAVEDALEGVLWTNDAQIARLVAEKVWLAGEGERPGVRIQVAPLGVVS